MTLPPAQLEAEKAKKEALEKKRTDMVRAMVAGKSFLDDDSPFEGMSPKDIEALVASAKAERATQGLHSLQGLQSYQGLQGSASLNGLQSLQGSRGLQETKGRAMVRQQVVQDDDPFEVRAAGLGKGKHCNNPRCGYTPVLLFFRFSLFIPQRSSTENVFYLWFS